MSDHKPPEEERINRFLNQPLNLKKIDPEIAKLYNENHQNKIQIQPRYSWWQTITSHPSIRPKLRQFTRFSKETLPMLVFVTFSTYMLIKMENQYDGMKQKLHNSKTLKEIEIEKEDEYITAALQGKKLNLDVQIKEETPTQKYKFEAEETLNDDEYQFDTQEDFYEGLMKDSKQGLDIPLEYQQGYQKYMSQRKPEKAQSKFDL